MVVDDEDDDMVDDGDDEDDMVDDELCSWPAVGGLSEKNRRRDRFPGSTQFVPNRNSPETGRNSAKLFCRQVKSLGSTKRSKRKSADRSATIKQPPSIAPTVQTSPKPGVGRYSSSRTSLSFESSG